MRQKKQSIADVNKAAVNPKIHGDRKETN